MIWIVLSILFWSELLFGVFQYKHPKGSVGKIDVVYTWVDGKDPEWQKSFHARKRDGKLTSEACALSRFRNHNELKYSLRSIWKYAPFVNHIYIVTSNQRPSWLLEHPKITVVYHDEIFYDKADLPTFNSQAIEANLHHIPDLSEWYIYFNDDVFLGKGVKPKDFYSKQARPKIFLASWPAPDGPLAADDESFTISWKNSNALLNKLVGNKKRRALEHAPFAFRRSQMLSLEECMPLVFHTVSHHPFRSLDDLLLTAGFSQYFLDNYGLVKRSKIESIVIGLKDSLEDNRAALKTITIGRPTTFCIQDAMQTDSHNQDMLLLEFFEAYFPNPAPWEKS